mgnify:FL=1
MDPNTFPTKGNLILAKNALALSKQGFDLMDKKKKYPDPGTDGVDLRGFGYPEPDR